MCYGNCFERCTSLDQIELKTSLNESLSNSLPVIFDTSASGYWVDDN